MHFLGQPVPSSPGTGPHSSHAPPHTHATALLLPGLMQGVEKDEAQVPTSCGPWGRGATAYAGVRRESVREMSQGPTQPVQHDTVIKQ